MRIVGIVFILIGLVACLTIIGIPFGIGMMFIGAIFVALGGRRRTAVTNVVQVSNTAAPEQRYTPPPEHAAYVPEVRQVNRQDAQKKSEDWRRYYNEERPHGAIGQKTP